MAPSMLEMARSLRSAAAAFDAALVTGDQAVTVAEELAATERACAAARARAAVRAADCRGHERRGFANAADWLARSAGSSVGEAQAAMATTKSSQACPATQAALAAGNLSLGQAQAITQTEAAFPGSEVALVDLATGSALSSLKDECRRRRLASIDPDELHQRQHQARELRHWRDEMGMVRLSGSLAPEVGVPIVNRLDAETDRIRRSARQEASTESRPAHAADALVSMLAGGGKTKATSAELVVVCDLRAFRRGHAHPGEPCHIVGGGPIPVEVAHRIAADAFVKAVVHDGVRIESVAHLGRHIPAELRTALDWVQGPPSTGRLASRMVAGAGTASSGTTSTPSPTAGPLLSTTSNPGAGHITGPRPRPTGPRASWAPGPAPPPGDAHREARPKAAGAIREARRSERLGPRAKAAHVGHHIPPRFAPRWSCAQVDFDGTSCVEEGAVGGTASSC